MPVTPAPAPLPPQSLDPTPAESQKNFLVTLLLSVFLGFLAVDQFYLGNIGRGIFKLLTFGGFGLWVIMDVILAATGNLRDRSKLPLADSAKYQKVGYVVLVLYVLGMAYAAVTYGQSRGITGGATTTKSSGAALSPADQERQSEITSLHDHLESYGYVNKFYPTFANMNDTAFRAAKLDGLYAGGYRDPNSADTQLSSVPTVNTYSYVTTPSGCDNIKIKCTGYIISAILSNGTPFASQSVGL